MDHLGLLEALHKATPPAQVMRWIGLLFNTITLIASIPEDKLQDTCQIILNSCEKEALTKKEIQSLVGKCLHIAQCCKPARLFTQSLLDDLKAVERPQCSHLSDQSKADLLWFYEFVPRFNGQHMFAPQFCFCVLYFSTFHGFGEGRDVRPRAWQQGKWFVMLARRES